MAAPFDVTVLTLGQDAEVVALAEEAVTKLAGAGLDLLYDDRDERAGVKFKDADLVGIPIRVAVGRRGVADRTVELKRRGESTVDAVPIEELAERAVALTR